MALAYDHRWTVEEYLSWAEGRRDHTELLDGRIVPMTPQRSAHFAVCAHVYEALRFRHPDAWVTLGCTSVGRGSAPEPDVALYRPGVDVDPYGRLADVELVVEVALSTSDYDRHDKARLYRDEGVVNYAVIDLAACEVVGWNNAGTFVVPFEDWRSITADMMLGRT